MKKYLIVRFSSFGDIAQAMPAARLIRAQDPSAEIHWLTRHDFHDFVKTCTVVDRVWSLNRADGFKGLLKLVRQLQQENISHIYDAHNNLRSLLISFFMWSKQPQLQIVRRPKNRLKRFLLFRFRINWLPKPFRGVDSFLSPLAAWFSARPKRELTDVVGLSTQDVVLDAAIERKLSQTVVLAPSATWELKRWPVEYWSTLVGLLPQYQFALLGGPEDTFCADIQKSHPENVVNWSGRLSWVQSTKIVALARAVVSGDTGILHVADILGRPTIALIGPTAFGYPSHPHSRVLEVELKCKPCSKDGRGRCYNAEFKKCLKDITPQTVARELENILTAGSQELRQI